MALHYYRKPIGSYADKRSLSAAESQGVLPLVTYFSSLADIIADHSGRAV
jgi:hypothetical protein